MQGWVAGGYTRRVLIGSHLSIAGSMANAVREARALGLDCVQVFTKNQQQWAAPALTDGAISEWRASLEEAGWIGGGAERTASHASYLINMASHDEVLRGKSIALMRDEIERCERLGIRHLVFHPGAFTTTTLQEGIGRIAEACAGLLRATAGYRTVLCLENVAGQGSTIGRRFEELAELRARIVSGGGGTDDAAERVGFCFDTCHAHAAGYDLSSAELARRALDEFERVVGLRHIRLLHLNDSKGAAGSRVDRHEHIGRGTIGTEGFGVVVRDERLAHACGYMETPKDGDEGGVPWDRVNADVLRRLMRGERVVVPRNVAAASGGDRTAKSAKKATKAKGAVKASRAKGNQVDTKNAKRTTGAKARGRTNAGSAKREGVKPSGKRGKSRSTNTAERAARSKRRRGA